MNKVNFSDIWTIIPTGGEGTRLRPFTGERSKAMVPIINNFPILEVILYTLAYGSGLKNFAFGTKGVKHYTNLHNYFQGGFGWSTKLGIKPEVNFEYQNPHYNDSGSADSVLYNIRNLKITNPIIVTPCDNLFEGAEVIDAYVRAIKSPFPFTVLLTYQNDVSPFGLADYDKKTGQIKKFTEKPKDMVGMGGIVNTGTYIIKPEVFDLLFGDFGKDVIPVLTSKGLVGGKILKSDWYDFGIPKTHLESVCNILENPSRSVLNFLDRVYTVYKIGNSKVCIRGKSGFSKIRRDDLYSRILSGGIKVNGNVFIGKDCSIGTNSYLSNCSIGDLSVIGANSMIEDSNILDAWEIGDDVKITRSFLGRGGVIENKCKIRDSFLADDIKVGKGCNLSDVTTRHGSRIPMSQTLRNIHGETNPLII